MFRTAVLCLIGFFSLNAFAQDWAELHNKLINFYGYQRAGLKGKDCANPYYANESLPHPHANDSYSGTDLSGGWYDAGDFVKFGIPFGYTVYTLLKGYEIFPNAYDDLDSWDYTGSPDGIPDILGEVKFATDYLIRAVIDEHTVVMDVGEGHSDHMDLYESARANSNRISNRTVKIADGADIPGLYAASLALMSELYRPYSESYADSCLEEARTAFACAVNQRTSGRPGYPGVSTPNGEFYDADTNSVWVDKALAGAIELYKATGEATYKEWVNTWNSELARAYDAPNFVSIAPMVGYDLTLLGTITSSGPTTNVAWAETMLNDDQIFNNHNDWATCRDAASIAFMAGLAFYLSGEEKYIEFAQRHVSWVAGHSPFSQSYVLGYNNGSSINPHHRNALTKSMDPVGGVVAGPDREGNFSFNAGDHMYTEVALDYNAGMIGAVAFLRAVTNPPQDQVKIDTKVTASKLDADLNDGPVEITATFDKSTDWILVLTGTKSGSQKTYAGSGSSVSVNWNGEADEGAFIAKENVTVMLDMDNIAPYHHDRKRTGFYLINIARQEFKSTDILIDDFNDNDFQNDINGVWTIFNDQQFGGRSRTYPADLGSAYTNAGLDNSGAVDIRLIGETGADHPHVGIKTTFSATDDSVSLGDPQSIIFDVLGGAGDTFYVELEQTDISDGAHYRAEVKLFDNEWNRIRVPISSFKQPEWKTEEKSLNLGSIRALRFTYYGTGNVNFILDNVHVEDLNIGDAISVKRGNFGYARGEKILLKSAPNGNADILIPVSLVGAGEKRVRLVSLRGRVVFDSVAKADDHGFLKVNVHNLPSGMYITQIMNKSMAIQKSFKVWIP